MRPDGGIRSAAGRREPGRLRTTLLELARDFGRAWIVNVVLTRDGEVAAAAAGDVGTAHDAAIARWIELHEPADRELADLVIVGCGPTHARDLLQAHERLVAASGWAKPGAPILWLAPATAGAGPGAFLPWFEAGKVPRHLAALRERFHPDGLAAYAVRRLAKDHPVHVVSGVSPDVLRPMGLYAFTDPAKALAHALASHAVRTCALLPA